jgi:hypothetical protein
VEPQETSIAITRAWSESAVSSLWLVVSRRAQEQQEQSPLLDAASELRGHEDIANREDFQRIVFICGVCRTVKALQQFAVGGNKHSINSVINPNSVSSQLG